MASGKGSPELDLANHWSSWLTEEEAIALAQTAPDPYCPSGDYITLENDPWSDEESSPSA